jgi:hypothetical protein
MSEHDFLTHAGATELAARVQAYWKARGYSVTARVVEQTPVAVRSCAQFLTKLRFGNPRIALRPIMRSLVRSRPVSAVSPAQRRS